MTIKIQCFVSIGYVGCTKKDDIEIEVYDDTTDEEIEEISSDISREWMFEQIEWGRKIIK